MERGKMNGFLEIDVENLFDSLFDMSIDGVLNPVV